MGWLISKRMDTFLFCYSATWWPSLGINIFLTILCIGGFFFFFISPLFNQVGWLRTRSHLQLRPGQDKAKQCDTNNNKELHME
jgi:hypothetical protein